MSQNEWRTTEIRGFKKLDIAHPFPAQVAQLKRNFGFLFHPMGKSLFIIFCAFLNFGVQAKTLGLATGVCIAADGVVLILLYLKYPHMYPRE